MVTERIGRLSVLGVNVTLQPATTIKIRGRDVQSVSQETKTPAIPQLIAAIIATESGIRAI
jgi:hypothetical protein